ncbi:DNA translocase FtsK [Rhizobium sp. FY34]|uniref:DNA translocase FtsK n=1 Tax=Rhizobium sp. FY34 TaxID=2562309 RepID=UPI0010C00673|nr:DNA translocase FtsK [Rhizobium sp. FY34]
MQFPRTNFNQASQTEQSEEGSAQTGKPGQNATQPTVDPNQATIAQAPWQAAFKLAPNVRFTRTPEAVLARPRGGQVLPVAPDERVPAAAGRLMEPVDMPGSAVNENATLAPELLVNALQGVASAMQQMPAADLPALPKVKPQPSPRALIFKRAKPPEPVAAVIEPPVIAPTVEVQMVAPDVQEALVSAPAPAPETMAVAAAKTPELWLSDFAIFESGIDLGGDMPVTAAMPKPFQPSAQRVNHVATPMPARRPAEVVRLSYPLVPNSVTSLYREVRPGTRFHQAAPTPAPMPHAPVPVAPAPVVAPVAPVFDVQRFFASQFAAARPVAHQASFQQVETVTVVLASSVEPVVVAPEPVIEPVAAPVAPPAPVRSVVQVSRRQPQGLPGLAGAMTVRESDDAYEFPPISLLQQPFGQQAEAVQPDALQQSAGLLESILEDFGVKGEIIDVRPGPVVTLYEFEPAPGVKSSRVIGLADDIARSMSALSARVAVVPGRNVIGIELPNIVRETVFLRELVECEDYWETKHRLALCLGKTIGGEPVIAELAKMPHLLVAGTTGSGKSVAINTMILSLLYRLRPEECRMIMIDPKMLELSVYDGIPHLLTPVVTDPKKAVLALKWAVREMEDRYRKMSRLGVRNIDGYNARAAQAREKGETITVSVQNGFDRNTGEIIYEDQELDLSPMPYIVVVVDEMADLMMVAGKEIEGAIQRLAQMARAAGIHLIMATQRPSVDVITGTIKANFPTRISFQVTSKIDSRTILGEQGAEHLLGQGDMLHMAGGGRISRVHGPFVSDAEVEHVVTHLKAQGRPDYLGTVTEDENDVDDEPDTDASVFDRTGMGAEDGDDLYDKAVKVVMKDRKCSTSYIQRRLSIGYNRAASLVERMEQEGLVGPANHVGKREIISGKGGGGSPSDD